MSNHRLLKFASYDQYKQEQNRLNKSKIQCVFVYEPSIRYLLHTHFDVCNIKRVLCHGTRNGAEQKIFASIIDNVYVLGTEIAETAVNFSDTVQWDFHDTNKEWIGKFDIVYSNSWDHANNPKKAFEVWVNQLNENGFLILEHSIGHTVAAVKGGDCFGCTLEYLKTFIEGIDSVQSAICVKCPEDVDTPRQQVAGGEKKKTTQWLLVRKKKI